MIFSEFYGAYYNTIAAILTEAVAHPVSEQEMKRIIQQYAFEESKVTIPDAIRDEKWQLIKKDGTTPIKNRPSMPLSTLQKRWLKAVSCDPRVRLFGEIQFDFPDVEPLFLQSDVIIFDQYNDGDPYQDPAYIANFRLILDAIRKKYSLDIVVRTRKGKTARYVMAPQYLEYSEKDDKFRLIGADERFGCTINLGRIMSCKPCGETFEPGQEKRIVPKPRSVVFELTDQRNALERILLHFAHFQKTAEQIAESRYSVTVHYDKEDETELVIRILSFGPMIKVTAPQSFVDLIKQRLIHQKSCEH